MERTAGLAVGAILGIEICGAADGSRVGVGTDSFELTDGFCDGKYFTNAVGCEHSGN